MRNVSIQKKILISMLIFTLIPILLVSIVTIGITYRTMRNQLIYDHRMSSGWLQNRIELENRGIMDSFYQFEVNKEVKSDIFNWCLKEEELDYTARLRMITTMNTVISMDSDLNSIDIYNYSQDEVLIAERSGAYMTEIDDRLNQWVERNNDLQSNLVFLKEGKEILACHQIYRFDDSYPIALVVFHLRPYQLEYILEEIKTVPEETILLFNDQNELMIADYGTNWSCNQDDLDHVRTELERSDSSELFYKNHFWFYRNVNGGKMQILLAIPDQTIAAALHSSAVSSIVVAVVAILASVICSITYSRAISKPIRKLSDEMKTLRLNEYDAYFSEFRKDEIGILQESFAHMIATNKALISQQYQAEIEKRNAQLRALQAQINPHFLYNTLQVIGGMALQKDAPEVYTVTTALSDILRYSLNFSKEMVPLAEEVEYLKSYVMIQNERFGDRVQLQLHLDPETTGCYIPKLIMQPLAENSFEHGFLEKSGEWILCVESSMVADDLLIRVRDNGIGIDRERLAQIQDKIDRATTGAIYADSHLGLANVHARIKLRSDNDAYGVKITSSPDHGTTVSVRMQGRWKEQDKE